MWQFNQGWEVQGLQQPLCAHRQGGSVQWDLLPWLLGLGVSTSCLRKKGSRISDLLSFFCACDLSKNCKLH